jgi:hypothetical protein
MMNDWVDDWQWMHEKMIFFQHLMSFVGLLTYFFLLP